METRMERIAPGLQVCVSEAHRFGTDAVLLTRFSRYGRKDLVCDLGTGCGIIPILMQETHAPHAIYAVDLQPEAIAQVEESLRASTAVWSEVHPICADLRTLWDGAPLGQVDVCTCNPPYQTVNSGKMSENPAQRVARCEVSCTVADVCAAANKLLRYGGRLCLCNRPERLVDTLTAMRQAGIEPKRLQFVAKDGSTPPWLFLVEGHKGGKPSLRVLPMQLVQGDVHTHPVYQEA